MRLPDGACQDVGVVGCVQALAYQLLVEGKAMNTSKVRVFLEKVMYSGYMH